jgi:protein-L-isoaspartate(D-aspartate) O-methyltransferase
VTSRFRLLAPAILLALLPLNAGCASDPGTQTEAGYALARRQMVEEQLAGRDITDGRVLGALRQVPRHLFVPPALRPQAYADYPLPIGEGQTISQPYIVALMTQCLGLQGGEKVLEVGTGSGYQAAVLAELAARVFSIEISPVLAAGASRTLEELGYGNVRVKAGDGFFGWPEEAPFDAIIVTAAPEKLPPLLFEQLKEGGRLVIPLGRADYLQVLTLFTKKKGRPVSREILDVRFVPMTGKISNE